MNYLAHAYLSFGQDDFLVGNFIGDYVKGKSLNLLPDKVRDGVLLHREIDMFTDSYPLVKAGQTYLRPTFGHYATVITDLYFDYFLGKHWERFSDVPLEDFVSQVYKTVDSRNDILPERFLGAFYWMKKDNWLLQYREITGLERALVGMSKRTRFDSKMEVAHLALLEKEAEFDLIFFAFFKDLETFARAKKQEIQKSHGSY